MIDFKRQNYIVPVGIMESLDKANIINGGIYDELPLGTRLEDINVIEEPTKKILDAFPSFNSKSDLTIENHFALSSKGNMEYKIEVVKYSSGKVKDISCSCPGFSFRRKCRHIKEVLEK